MAQEYKKKQKAFLQLPMILLVDILFSLFSNEKKYSQLYFY